MPADGTGHTGTMPDEPARSQLRGLLMGSGSGLAEAGMAELAVELSGRAAAGLPVLYLGTATYDAPEPRARQTAGFERLGCSVRAFDVATRRPQQDEAAEAIERAAVIVASGGNTLYAVDRWVALGLDRPLRAAALRGVVVCGGSAGAICWFDGGHSDSMDPTSYREPLPPTHPRATAWRYVRVDGLGLLPGLLCPHYDVTQRNGVPRALDFGRMLSRHHGERGLGLDDAAGLLVADGCYRVVAPDGRAGSMAGEQFVDDGSGQPGLWILEGDGAAVSRRAAPAMGVLAELLRAPRAIAPDPLIGSARAENPIPRT
jgi:dipeptidase E